MKTADELTPSEQRFIDEYLVALNGVRAYRAAFPEAVSYGAAAVAASQLLKKPKVRAAIHACRREQQRRCRIKADLVLKELAMIAFADLGECFDDCGRPRPLAEIPLETRRAIREVKRDRRTGEVIGYRLFEKVGGLEKLFRYLGLETAVAPLESVLTALGKDTSEIVREHLQNGLRS